MSKRKSTSNENVPGTSMPCTETNSNDSDEVASLTNSIGNLDIRDPSSEGGCMPAHEAYIKYLKENHPDCNEKVYRVPWTFIGTSPVGFNKDRVQNYTSHNETFPEWILPEGKIRGDNAEKRVADSLEWLLKTEENPAFILAPYHFRYFCNQEDEPPPDDKKLSKEKGEHDIVIIHFKYGIFFIQVKGCDNSNYHKRLKKARDQLERDITFFSDNFKDYRGSKSAIVALPNVKKSIPGCLLDCHLPCHSEGREERESNLKQWWTEETKQCTGFLSFADYCRVVAKYVGYKSTVKAPMNQLRESIRSPAEVITEIGNRYMNITLSPQQIYILNNHLPKLIIRGQHGCGKTTMLILKAREMIAQKICIISMAKSPLLEVLADSIRCDMTPFMSNNMIIEQVDDHSKLTTMLQRCAEEERHVFIDEVPSSLENDQTLKNVINSYPNERFIWAIMSCERDDNLKPSLGDIFRGFAIAVLHKVLRCPPSIFQSCKTTEQREETLNLEGVQNFFEELGLSSQSPPRSLKWSDVTVVNAMSEKTDIIQWLEALKCPFKELRNMIDYTEEQFKSKADELKNTETILVTNRLPQSYVLSYKKITVSKGGEIYIKEANVADETEVVSKKTQLAELLWSHGICTTEIKNCAKNNKQQMRKDKERNMIDNTNEIIFVVKPSLYYFFEKLQFPLVTPCDIKEVLRRNAILFTDKENLAGFERKMVLRIINRKVHANKELHPTEGPNPLTVDHTGHTGTVNQCTDCQQELRGYFQELGLVPINANKQGSDNVMEQASGRVMGQESHTDKEQRSKNIMEQHKKPSSKLGLCDVIVLDDREPKRIDVVGLLQKIDIDTETDEVEPYGYENKVVYTTPEMFRGLEKKVVVLVTDNGYTDLAVSRCSSQLIIFKTDRA
ncbi:uncharacterized protein [Haliotis cracherodii]|uniref:uncharacterized protein isoform X2 n=1 Tax=Haliotis cracherodii TaxID=6455 RepID=UPI0039EAB9F9